jgi:tetratricopeptide (TPR) repeat protein
MLIRKGETEEAEKVLAKATELMPKDEDAWYFYGMAQVNNGNLDAGVASFEKSLKIFSRSARAIAGLATAAMANNDYKKAADAYEQSYQITHDPRYLMEKGRALFFGKDYRGAQAAFNQYTTVFTKDPQGHLWYGLAAMRLNEKEFGLKKIEEAAKLNPNDPLISASLKAAQKGESVRFERETDEVAAAPEEKKDENPFANAEKKGEPGKAAEAAKGEAKTEVKDKKKQKVKMVDDE